MTETPKKKCEKCDKGLVKHEQRTIEVDGVKKPDPFDIKQWDLCAPCGGAGVVPDIPAGKTPAVRGGGSIVDTFNKTVALDPVQSITLEEIDRALDLKIDPTFLRQLEASIRRCLEYSTTARADRPGRRADEETIWNFGTVFAGKA